MDRVVISGAWTMSSGCRISHLALGLWLLALGFRAPTFRRFGSSGKSRVFICFSGTTGSRALA
jgi:hypothetical protein